MTTFQELHVPRLLTAATTTVELRRVFVKATGGGQVLVRGPSAWLGIARGSASRLAVLTSLLAAAACQGPRWPQPTYKGPPSTLQLLAADPDSGKFQVRRRVLSVWFDGAATPADVRRVLDMARGEVLDSSGDDLIGGRRHFLVVIPDPGETAAQMTAVRDPLRRLSGVSEVSFNAEISDPQLRRSR